MPPTSPVRQSARVLGAIAACVAAGFASAQPIVVFGDSLSDTGNVLAFSQSPLAQALGFTPRPDAPWYQPGQFTNGTIGTAGLATTAYTQGTWVNVLADRLGRDRPQAAGLTPDITPLGTNYAWGGAQASEGSLLPPLATQVGFYLNGPASPAPDTLYTFWLGGNDLINAAKAPDATPASIAAAGANAITALQTNIQAVTTAASATDNQIDVLWANLPALDRTPEGAALSPQLRDALAAASADFRLAQLTAASDLRLANPSLNLLTLDVYTLFNQILDNPASYGLIDVTTPVLDAPDFTQAGPFLPSLNVPITANPDQYAFWDSLHPTAHMHALIGHAAANLVPAPGVASLLAFVGILATPRRRRAIDRGSERSMRV
jgi:phospholipase/lecithinase/hemolysin